MITPEQRIADLEDILADFTVALKSLLAETGIMKDGRRIITVANSDADYTSIKVEFKDHGGIEISAKPV